MTEIDDFLAHRRKEIEETDISDSFNGFEIQMMRYALKFKLSLLWQTVCIKNHKTDSLINKFSSIQKELDELSEYNSVESYNIIQEILNKMLKIQKRYDDYDSSEINKFVTEFREHIKNHIYYIEIKKGEPAFKE